MTKLKNVLLIIVALLVLVGAVGSTIISVNAGNDFKVANEEYKSSSKIDSILDAGDGYVSTTTEVAKKTADDCSAKFKKFFAVSILLYLALILLAGYYYFSVSKPRVEEEAQTE